jgi:hypothetical protein
MSSGTRRNLADRTQFETLVDRDLDAAQRAMIAHIQNVHRSTLEGRVVHDYLACKGG